MPNFSGHIYELSHLTAEEVVKAVDAIGGACVWNNNHCYPTQQAVARPMGCGCYWCRAGSTPSGGLKHD